MLSNDFFNNNRLLSTQLVSHFFFISLVWRFSFKRAEHPCKQKDEKTHRQKAIENAKMYRITTCFRRIIRLIVWTWIVFCIQHWFFPYFSDNIVQLSILMIRLQYSIASIEIICLILHITKASNKFNHLVQKLKNEKRAKNSFDFWHQQMKETDSMNKNLKKRNCHFRGVTCSM